MRSYRKQFARKPRWLPLLLLAFLVQSLFPNGTMPGSLADGQIVMLCPDDMPFAYLPQFNSGQESAHHHHGHGSSQSEASVDSASDESASVLGDCQLGSAGDQPLILNIASRIDNTPHAERLTTPLLSLHIVGRSIPAARSRGPPVS